eukprot:1294301-Karenia_brevis.AAC.1
MTQLKLLQQQVPTPPFNLSRTITPLLQQLRQPSTIAYGCIKHISFHHNLQMPSCNTTQISMTQHPNFTITIHAPTKKNPNSQLPTQVILQAKHTMLPTPTLTIRVPEQLQMAHGRRVSGSELKVLLDERMQTWQTPYLSTVEVIITTEQLSEIET